MIREEMEIKVREYITEDDHRLEDYSDLEICCKDDYEDAVEIMDKRIANSSDETLEEFCRAIDEGEVDYMKHGCR